MKDCIYIHNGDDVAVALRPLKKGEAINIDGVGTVICTEDIPQGHKICVHALKKGDEVHKYGLVIGHTTQDINVGDWIHTHNMKTNLSGEVTYTYNPVDATLPSQKPATFMGFRRPDGRAAIRNEIWIIPTVGCVNDVAHSIAQIANEHLQGSVEGVYAFTHPFGCSQTGKDLDQTERLLAALSKHPNATGVLFLSLGCENCTHEHMLQKLGDFDQKRIRFLTCQEVDDEIDEGVKICDELIKQSANLKREPILTSELVIGLKCGGSDGLSGITANPVIGRVSDTLVAQGGTTALTEVPEMFGAESLLLNRCTSKEVFDRAASMLNNFKDYFLSHHEVVYDNPSPGNKEGGITTLEDKSCGCVQKGGTAPIVDVVEYADTIKKHGVNMLNSPGNDIVSTTALAVAGCHMVLFSTGRGTPFGSPVPTLKIFTNSHFAKHKGDWMDFNAGVVADGTRTLGEAGNDLFKIMLDVASGKRTTSERNGYREISIWKDGVTL